MGMIVSTAKSVAMKDMNITPFIDILLVLLIIFMVITPLTPKGLDAALPHPAKGGPEPPGGRSVVVSVLRSPGAEPTLLVNRESVSWEALPARLAEIYKTRAERVLFVRADVELGFAHVARVIDIAYGAGVDQVGLVTAKIEAGV